MAEPSDEAIAQVHAVTNFGLEGVQRDIVAQALRSNGCDVEKVLGEFFDGQDAFVNRYQTKWDDSVFSGDRDVPQQGPESHHIEALDATYASNDVIHGIDPSKSTAPSRPPSRMNNSSMETAYDVPARWDQNDAGLTKEDLDTAEAMRQSRQMAEEAGIVLPDQESGVMDTDQQVSKSAFGPATRAHYDEQSWGMTFAGQQVQVSASKRERQKGAPAFLVESSERADKSRLGGYLTILHEIPLARNLYLSGAGDDTNYGNDPQWWDGVNIKRPHVLGDGDNGELQWENEDNVIELRDELQRLMAVLDSTNRSYASVQGLVNLKPELDSERFYHDRFADYFKDEDTVAPLFTKVMIERSLPAAGSVDGSSDSNEGVQNVHTFDLDIERHRWEGVTCMTGLIDAFMWYEYLTADDETISEARMAVLEDEAEVFVVNLNGVGPTTSIDVSEVFYRERWLASRKEEAVKIMNELRKLRREERAANKNKLELWNAPGIGDKRSRLNEAKEKFDSYRQYLEGRARFRTAEESGFDADKYPYYHMAPYELTEEEAELDAKLKEAADAAQMTLEKGRRRSDELTAELERIQKKRDALRRLLTDPEKKGRPKPMTCKKYLLAGIATKDNIVYVCRRAPEDLIELSGAPQEKDQWWRLELKPSDTNEPVKTEMLEFEDVMKRVWSEIKTPMFVYASEAAARASPTALPTSLERFVKADNKAFQQELSQEAAQVPDTIDEPVIQTQEFGIPFSPTKRKASGSVNSMDSNRGSVGSDGGNDPFRDEGEAPTSPPTRPRKRHSPESSQDNIMDEQPPPLPQRHGSTEPTAGPEMLQRPNPSIFINQNQTSQNDAMDIDD